MSIFHPSRMENCRLDFDTRDKFTVAVVASKIASLLFSALREAAKWTNHKHRRESATTWCPHGLHGCLHVRCIADHTDVIYVPSVCPLSLTDGCIKFWLGFSSPGGINAPAPASGAGAEPDFTYATRLTLAIITDPVYWGKSSSSSSSLSSSSSSSLLLLWELDRQTPPTCREMNAESGYYKCTNGHWKIILTQRFTHTYTDQRVQDCSPSCWIMYGEACCHKEMKSLTSRYIEEV